MSTEAFQPPFSNWNDQEVFQFPKDILEHSAILACHLEVLWGWLTNYMIVMSVAVGFRPWAA